MLTDKPMHGDGCMLQLLQPREADLGMRVRIGCHTFRAPGRTGITAYLESGRTLENAQLMAAHESPCTPKRYDRTVNEITLDEVGTLYVLRTGRTAPAL